MVYVECATRIVNNVSAIYMVESPFCSSVSRNILYYIHTRSFIFQLHVEVKTHLQYSSFLPTLYWWPFWLK